ncbi:MAG: hypothetical protein IPK25_02210 [Saprospiraceae bacterium]|nr:hypothetical protein [Saprospiraceae bacterium]
MTLSNGSSTELFKLDLRGNIIKKVEFHWLKQLPARSGSSRIISDSNGNLLVRHVQNKHGVLKLNTLTHLVQSFTWIVSFM